MKFFKKNQVIISVIALMLMAAGYLNFTNNGSNFNKTAETGSLIDSEQMAAIGDAQLVSTKPAEANEIKDESLNVTVENIIKNETENIIEQVEEKTKEELKDTERTLKVQRLQEENSDIVGWLEIPNTTINYPVLQGKDNEYYMYHNYKKQKSKNGSIFLTKDYDWSIPSSNLLIYGHNMQNGTMFQELLRYKKEEFYKQHPIIRFTTEKEDAEYEIISVFPSRVYYKSEKNVFRYYYFVNAKNEAEYNEFVKNAKKASLYDIEATAEYGDPLLTLSTCSYHTEDGRFAVVARKRK